MNIEDLIKDSVDDMVREVPPRANLADDALRQARRQQRTTRMVVTGATTVAVVGGAAVAVTDPLSLWTGSNDAAPASQPARAQDDAHGDAAQQESTSGDGQQGSGVVDLDKLSAGSPPDTPWFADGAVHFGDAEVPFDVPFSYLRALEPVQGGAVALTVPEDEDQNARHEGWGVYLVGQDGDVEQLAEGFVTRLGVSADGTRVAWGEEDWGAMAGEGPDSITLNVFDVTTGDVVHSRLQTGSESHIGSVAGFLGDDRVLLDGATNGPSGVFIWDLPADEISQWSDYGFTRALAASGDVGAFVPPNDGEYWITDVADTASGEVLWSVEMHTQVASFSPDGRYAALIDTNAPPSEVDGVNVHILDTILGPSDIKAGAVVPYSDEEITVTQEMIDAAKKYEEWQENWDGRSDVVLADARTGEEVTRTEAQYPQQLTWESDGTLVFVAWDGTERAALARCSIDGGCELATEPRQADEHPDAALPPYNLGGL